MLLTCIFNKKLFLCLFLAIALSCQFNCKSPASPDQKNSNIPTISISCNPQSGGYDTIVTVVFSIKANKKEIKSFALELNFKANMFQFLRVIKGSLTEHWATVDGNEIQPGKVKIGGFAGSGNHISPDSRGSLVLVKLKVSCKGCNNGQKGDICIKKYEDDIQEMQPASLCIYFTYSK